MNLIAKYLSRFLRRLSVPHCEDCVFMVKGFCAHRSSHIVGIFYNWADVMRRRDMPCGKRGRHFEPKEAK